MPLVTARPIGQSNGDIVTEFVDSVGTIPVTWSYLTVQNRLRIRNLGRENVTVVLNGASYPVEPGTVFEADEGFTSFQMSGVLSSQQIIVTATQTMKKSILDIVYPEWFGAKGDGEANDAKSWNAAIAYAEANGYSIMGETGRVYNVPGGLLVDGVVDVDFNGSKLLASASDPVIFCDHDQVNTKSGTIKNLIIDCNNISAAGIYVNVDRRRIFNNIKIINLKSRGIDIRGGNVDKFYNIYIESDPVSQDTTAIYNEAADMVFDHIDYKWCKIGVDHAGGNAFYSEVHGFINHADQYEGSIFFRQSSINSVFLDRCYPDTQQYAYYLTRQARLSITNNYGFINSEFLSSEIVAEKGPPHLFYFEHPSSAITSTDYVRVQNSSFLGLILEGVSYSVFSNLTDHYVGIDASTSFRGFVNPPGAGVFDAVSFESGHATTRRRIHMGLETATTGIDISYTPSVHGKLSNTIGKKICSLRNSRIQPTEAYSFVVPYGIYTEADEGEDKIKYKGQVIAYIGTDNFLYVKAFDADFTNNTGLCNAGDTQTYRIRVNAVIPTFGVKQT